MSVQDERARWEEPLCGGGEVLWGELRLPLAAPSHKPDGEEGWGCECARRVCKGRIRRGKEAGMGKGWLWWWRHVAKSEPLARLGCTNGRAGRGECATGVCKSEHAEGECVRRPAMDGSGSHQPLPHSAPHGWWLKPNREEGWEAECARRVCKNECARPYVMAMWTGAAPIGPSLPLHPTGGGSDPLGNRDGRASVQDECARVSVQGDKPYLGGGEELPLAAPSHHTHPLA